MFDFVAAVNKFFQSAWIPRFSLLDKSMIKSFHRDIKIGKIKIIRKPRPIGNEIKNLADAVSQTLLNLELYESKEKKCVKDYKKITCYSCNCNTLYPTVSWYC